ncbi:MAG: ATP-binding protein, partial [Deltaproteobacteria bacterium]|nr:ATP-binding protein [Deltaproteobacteria bacterium]
MTSKNKLFNTSGPCNPEDHYMLPTLSRIPNVKNLINDKEYFVIHAPHQLGKTTAIKETVNHINQEGNYYALYCNLEILQSITDTTIAMDSLMATLIAAMRASTLKTLIDTLDDPFFKNLKDNPGFKASPLQVYLSGLCERLDKDLVIFFDEADCLEDEVLMSFMTQLKDGYLNRAEIPYPRSIAIAGILNIYDYKIKISSQTYIRDCPFKTIKRALKISNFTHSDLL